MDGREASVEQLKTAEKAALEEMRNYEAELLSAAISEDAELAREYSTQVERLAAEKEQKRERRESLVALLKRKECANDYLEYLEEKKKRDEKELPDVVRIQVKHGTVYDIMWVNSWE